MEKRILIHTPHGRDAQVIEQVLSNGNMSCLVCDTPESFFLSLVEGAAAAIVTEEALSHLPHSQLNDWLVDQPSWSDFPFIVMATKQDKRRSVSALHTLQRLGNIVILERPVNAETLLSAAQSATRARSRQYLARQQLEEISRTHEQLRLAQTAGGIGVFVVDIATDIMAVSEEFCHLFGFPPVDAVIAKDIEALVIKDSNDHPVSNMNTRKSGTAALNVEYCIRRKDNGALRWIARRAKFTLNAAGVPVSMHGVVQDVTERKVAESTLRESESRFRALTETMPNQVWTALPDGKLDWVNQKVCEYCGIDSEQLLNEGWESVVHPEDLPNVIEKWRHSLTTKELYETEFRIRRKDGQYRWHLARALTIDSGDDSPRWLGTNTDIEDQKATHIQLADVNAILELRVAERTRDLDRIWRLATDLMMVAQLDGTIVAANPAWTEILDWQATDLIGLSCLELAHPDERGQVRDELEKLSRGITTRGFETRTRHRDGSYRDIAWTAVPDEYFIHAVGRDITAEKSAALMLEETESRLRQSQKMEALGQLTGGIAHDFNNLLQGITGSLDALRRRAITGSSDAERFIETATTSAARAAALVHRLLAFSRQQSLDNQEVDINRLVSSMEDLLRRTLGPELGLDVSVSQDPWLVLSDENQLESAILNLAINARDAMPDGGRLTLSTHNVNVDAEEASDCEGLKPGEYVLITVADTGTGMPPDVLAKAFDPFFTTKPIGQGTGLGLSMIYGFAKQSEGHVRLESEPGKGTRVSLYLPRYGASIKAQEVVEIQQAMPAGDGETVLVLDDEPIVRMLIIEELELLGYNTLEAGESGEALPLLKSGRKIDLLLSDVGLPGMNGRQVAEIARQLRPDLPVLFMTGYAEGALARSEFLGPGMQMMTKPFQMEDLAQRIKQILAPGTQV